ncbi:MAG: hypothetical protein QF515_03245 [Pseudomonadales bacterium]|nr:hypothetical protein [Pseudomonadales bacterium]
MRKALSESFNAIAAEHFDGAFRIDAGDTKLAFNVRDGHLTALADTDEVDLILYFENASEALDILTGSADVIDAFMQGRFRSDGYLIWVFTLLAMFR